MMPAEPHGQTPVTEASEEPTLDESEELDFGPMPPKATGLMTVHLRFAGRGKPLPYPLDDIPLD
jgi:hypothetical protein